MLNHFSAIIISLTLTMLILIIFVTYDNHNNFDENDDDFSKKIMPETIYGKYYSELAGSKDSVVIYPILTQSAYDWNGFHDFYLGRCDSCLSVPIHNFYDKKFASSGNTFGVLEFLGYDVIDDVYLDQNPQILGIYKKVILLHNEFVTRNEFDAITSHPNVVYLYPNSLNSEVKTDYSANTISLLRGPGFPEESRINGFDWEFDNTRYMSDWDCTNWKFEKIKNGYMLNCYPEKYILDNAIDLLKSIKNL